MGTDFDIDSIIARRTTRERAMIARGNAAEPFGFDDQEYG